MSEHQDIVPRDPDPALRLLETALEEHHMSVPDLRHRVLAASEEHRQAAAAHAAEAARSVRGPRRLWVAAAVVLLGVGASWGIYQLSRPAQPGGGGEVPILVPSNPDPNNEGRSNEGRSNEGSKQDPKLVRPKNKAEFLKHLKTVERITIQVSTTKKHSHSFAKGNLVEMATDKAAIAKITGLMAKDLQPARAAGWIWPNQVRLHLKDGRHMLTSMYRLGKPRLAISGLGDWAMGEDLASELGELIDQAEERARMKEGVVFTRADLERVGPKSIPSSIERLTCYALMDEDLKLLKRFTKVTLLDLRGCSRTLEGPGMAHVARLVSLRKIMLNNTHIDDDALAQLGALPELSELNLTYATHIEGTGFRAFQKTNKLRRLRMSLTQRLSDRGIQALAGVHSLEYLNLSGRSTGQVTAAGLMQLGRCKNLTALDLSDCPLDMDEAIAGFGNLFNLEFLDLSDTNVSVDGLHAFHFIRGGAAGPVATGRGMKFLYFARCKNIDDRALDAITRFSNLEELDLSRCTKITDDGLVHLTRLLKIKTLRLAQRKMGAHGCKHVAGLPMLLELDLSSANVDDAGVEHLSKNASIRSLDLSGCDAITDKGLAMLATMKGLGRLDLNTCDGFSRKGVDDLAQALPSCEFVWPQRFRKNPRP